MSNGAAVRAIRSSLRRFAGIESPSVLRGTLVRFSLVSGFVKVVGFSRTAVIAAMVGAGAHLDAYFATQVIIGVVMITFADQFEMVVGQRVRWAADTGGVEGIRQTGSRLFALALALGGLCSLAYLGAYPLLYRWLANPAANVPSADYVKLALIFLPFVAMYVPYRAVCALLKGAGRYDTSFALDAAQAVTYLVLTVLFLTLTNNTSSSVLAVSAAHVLSQLLLLLVALWTSREFLMPSTAWRPRLENVREYLGEASTLYLFGVLFFGFTLLDRHFAAVALVGGLSLLSFASTISQTIRSTLSFEQVYGIEFGMAGNRQEILTRAIRTSLRVGIPAVVIQAVFAHELIQVAFQRGRFSAEDASAAASVLVAYGIATLVFLVWPLVLRMLQAVSGFRGAFKLLPWGLAAALASGLILVPVIGLPGAVAATGIGHLVLVTGGIVMLGKSNLRALSASDALIALARLAALALVAPAIRVLIIGQEQLLLRLGVAVLVVLFVDALLVRLFTTRALADHSPAVD